MLPGGVNAVAASQPLYSAQYIIRTAGRDIIQIKRQQVTPRHSPGFTPEAVQRARYKATHILQVVLNGLRRSELLGLQWDSIDFEAKTMTIRHTVSKVTEVVAKDKTKNASSRRTFPLTPEALEIFKDAKCLEAQNRIAFGKEYQENCYVFKWADGHTYSPDYVSHRFNDLLKKHSLPHIRFHELRHSCASMLISMGWTLKDVQEWLGHSDIKMTANIYSHLDTARKNNIAAALAEKFGA